MKAIHTLFATALALPFLANGPATALVGTSAPADSLSSAMVMVLERTTAGAGFCSGTVLARNAVLTAAHCITNPQDMRVHFRDDSGQPVLMEVAASAVHPLFRSNAPKLRERSIDLALLRTTRPLPGRFQPAALDRGTALAIGSHVRIAGFGVTREGAETTGGKLRVGILEVRAPISSILLWADDPAHAGGGACSGDSGGPVLAAASDVVIAVTDWATGVGLRHCGGLTQAALVAPQHDWIDSVLRQWEANFPT